VTGRATSIDSDDESERPTAAASVAGDCGGLDALGASRERPPEEIVQEAFVRTLARWRHVDERSEPLAYVRKAVVNLCHSRFRRRVLNFRRLEPVPSAEVTASETRRRDDLLAAMATLPLRQREVVALRYFGGLSTNETADTLSIAPGTVKAHLHRALTSLRTELEDYRHG
jgi:RNA polymerase sigma factor (sigma-70 family)